MTELSPAAQAVANAVDHYESIHWLTPREVAAVAFRAVADQAENVPEWGEGWLEGVQDVVAGFRRIADELEAM